MPISTASGSYGRGTKLSAARVMTAIALVVSLAFAATAASATEHDTGDSSLGWNPDTGIYQMIFPIDGNHSYGDT